MFSSGRPLPQRALALVLVSFAGHFHVFSASSVGLSGTEEGPKCMNGLNCNEEASNATLWGEAGDMLSDSLAQARDWANMIVADLTSGAAAPFMNKWFGGAGSGRAFGLVYQRFSWIKSQLDTGMAGDWGSQCPSGRVAYILRGYPSKSFDVATGSRCSGLVDCNGRYIIHFCGGFRDSIMPFQLGTIFHEGSHITGTLDTEGDIGRCLHISAEVAANNAYSFGYFAQDLVGSKYGCPVSGEVFPNEGNCAGYKAQGYCSISPSVAEQCRYTCGSCHFPSGGGGGGCTDGDPNCAAHYRQYCNQQHVRDVCKKTCGVCSLDSNLTVVV